MTLGCKDIVVKNRSLCQRLNSFPQRKIFKHSALAEALNHQSQSARPITNLGYVPKFGNNRLGWLPLRKF